LAADALFHKNQPLWLNYYATIKEDTNQIIDAKKRNDLQAAQKASASLSAHYSIIRPAIIISRNEEVAVRMDSVITFIEKQVADQANFENNLESGVAPLKLIVEELFFKDKSTLGPIPGVSVPRSIIMGLTSVIITVLSFVAWKKFHGGRKPIY
jgi:sporulation protein YpjB